jgi:hypothetical protein
MEVNMLGALGGESRSPVYGSLVVIVYCDGLLCVGNAKVDGAVSNVQKVHNTGISSQNFCFA